MKRDKVIDPETGWMKYFDSRYVIPILRLPQYGAVLRSELSAINLKGTNGSGKSTVIFELLKEDPNWVYLVGNKADKKPLGIYSSMYNTAIVGTYFTKCGGCDYLGNTQIVKHVLKLLWTRNVNILYEGVIVGDIKSTFYELMKELSQEQPRFVSFCFMGTTLKECLARIQRRNGGKQIKEAPVIGKYENSKRHLRWYLDNGVHCTVLNTRGTTKEVFRRFMKLYGSKLI